MFRIQKQLLKKLSKDCECPPTEDTTVLQQKDFIIIDAI